MTIHRRDAMKVGAVGIFGALNSVLFACTKVLPVTEAVASAPVSSSSMRMRIRGLCLLEYQSTAKTLYLRFLDAQKQSMPKHEARLVIDKGVVDEDATSSEPSRKDNAGTSKERWVWLLKGITVAVLPDDAAADTQLESSNPSTERPILGNWKSLKWIPDLNKIGGATAVNGDPSLFVCNIPVQHGLLQGEPPKGRVGDETKWTVKKKTDSSLVTRQYFSDTAVLTRKLQGRTAVITVSGVDENGKNIAGKIVLRQSTDGEIVFENMDPTLVAKKGDPTSLGHFLAFFGVVNTQYQTDWTPDPITLSDCDDCETDPIFCPPARI